MNDDTLLVLGAPDVRRLIAGRESEIIAAVARAYCEHQSGKSFLPHSVFVRFPGRVKERIIALPGYLGGEDEIAGIKWIASFPGNLARGLSRASAIMVLNGLETGRPEVVLEASLISAARTAASAALAADVIHRKGRLDVVGIVGCGLINREIIRFLASLGRGIGELVLFDISSERAASYRESLAPIVGDATSVRVASRLEDVLAGAPLVSFATTAVEPTVTDLSMCPPGGTILHISLRDLVPEAILAADNVVDDVDHVMRAQTSVHLAEQKAGHRDFVRCTLAQILMGDQPPRRSERETVVFSPFGLGVLDLAVGRLVASRARASGVGRSIEGFFEGA